MERSFTFVVLRARVLLTRVASMNGKELLLIAALAVVVLLAASAQVEQNSAQVVLKEVGRLVELNQHRNLTSSDLSNLRLLILQSEAAVEEFREVEFFALHQESRHVDHALPGVYTAFSGIFVPCPLDDLAHVSVYLRYNELELAEESLEEARGSWPSWREKARNTKREVASSYPLLGEMEEKAKRIFAAVNLREVREDLKYIEENGFC